MMRASNRSSLNSLGEKVAKLQKLRKSSSTTFFTSNSDEVDENHFDKGNIKQLLNDEQVHAKLKSTVLLLAESLEEQGRLRALLEYTADPNLLIVDGKYNGSDHERELKYRSAILAQEKLLADTIELRARYEDEKQKRIQLEKSVEITNQILLEVQLECDNVKEELLTTKRSMNSSIHSSRIADGLSRSTGSISRALPPLAGRPPVRPLAGVQGIGGSSRNNITNMSSINSSGRYDAVREEEEQEEQQLPPLPLEEEEGDNEELDHRSSSSSNNNNNKALLSKAVASYVSSRSGSAASAAGVPPIPNQSSSSSTAMIDNSVLKGVSQPATAESPPLSTVPSSSSSSTSVHRSVLLDVDLGGGQKDSILIHQDSDPMSLSFDFIEKHGLKPEYFEPLLEYIRATQETLESHLMNGSAPAIESKGAVVSSSADKAGVSSPTLNLRGAKTISSKTEDTMVSDSPEKAVSSSSSGGHLKPLTSARGGFESPGPLPSSSSSAPPVEISTSQSISVSPVASPAASADPLPLSPARQLEQLSIIPSRANGLLEPAPRVDWSTHGRIPVVPHPIALTVGKVCSSSSSNSVFGEYSSPSRNQLVIEEEEDQGPAVDFSQSIKSAIKTYQSISRELKAAKRLGLAGDGAVVSSDLSESEEEDKKSYESFSLSSSSDEEEVGERVQPGKRRGAQHKRRDGPEEDNYDQLAALTQKQKSGKASGTSPTPRRNTHKSAPVDENSLMMNRFQGGGSVPAKGSKNRRTSVFGEIVTRSPTHPDRFKVSDDEEEEEEEEGEEPEQLKKKTSNSKSINQNGSNSKGKKHGGRAGVKDEEVDEELLDLSDTEYKAPKRKTIHKKMDKFQATAPMMGGKRMSNFKKPPFTNRFERTEITRPSVFKQLGGTRVPQHSMLSEEQQQPSSPTAAAEVGAEDSSSLNNNNRVRTSSEQSQGNSSGGFTPPALTRAPSSLRFSDEVRTDSRPAVAPLVRQQSQASSLRANHIRSSINDYHAALGSTKDSKELKEIFTMAVEVFDRASKLNSAGNLHESLPMYQNALKLFRLSKFDGIQHIQEEVSYWENKARDSRRALV